MKEIIRADHSGFCFGVKAAIEKAEKAADECQGKIYSCGSLIHNKLVTDQLTEKGIQVISSPDEADPGATVIIRSHGEGKAFYDRAEARNCN